MPYQAPQPTTYYESVERMKDTGIKQQAFWYMGQLIGWCSDLKAGILIDLILKYKPEKIVEIGVFGGKSLVPMAYALKVNGTGIIYGIDPWSNFESIQGSMDPNNKHYWGWVDHQAILRGMLEKIQEFDLGLQIEIIEATSANAPPIADIDLLHIDGNHSDATTYVDVTKWVPLMKSGGWIIFDDMSWYENGVFTASRAIEWLDNNCIKFAEYTDTDTWGIWYKP